MEGHWWQPTSLHCIIHNSSIPSQIWWALSASQGMLNEVLAAFHTAWQGIISEMLAASSLSAWQGVLSEALAGYVEQRKQAMEGRPPASPRLQGLSRWVPML